MLCNDRICLGPKWRCIMEQQTIQVAPKIVVSEGPFRLHGPVSITVYDERTIPQIGTQFGIDKQRNFIYLDEHFAHSIKIAMDHALQTLGMEPVSSTSVPRMQVYIDRLSYAVPKSEYVSNVHLKAAIRVEVWKKGRRYTEQYLSEERYRVIKTPSYSQNAEMVNAVINNVLAQVLADISLLDFLRKIAES